jgi:hypothetical protein
MQSAMQCPPPLAVQLPTARMHYLRKGRRGEPRGGSDGFPSGEPPLYFFFALGCAVHASPAKDRTVVRGPLEEA